MVLPITFFTQTFPFLQVNPGSLADSGGLKVGDIIIKICGQNAETISHTDAQDVIVRAGNNLEITVAKLVQSVQSVERTILMMI